MPSIDEAIRAKLLQLIDQGKTSQYRLTREAGVDQSHIWKFLHGQASMSTKNLTKLCRAAGIRRIDIGDE